jgi:hypothetical protein
MAPVKDQIVRDIDKWARMRLQQWLEDVMDRYDMADVSVSDGFAHASSILTIMAARCVSVVPEVSPQEAGEVFAAMVACKRKQKEGKQ